MMKKIGGRLLSHNPGSTSNNLDEYRGQRRRPWMAIRVGNNILNKTEYLTYIEHLWKCLREKGLLLDEQGKYLMFKSSHNEYEVSSLSAEVEEALEFCRESYEKGPMSIPIAILVNDIFDVENQSSLDIFVDNFSDRINFFQIDAFDIKDELTEKNWSELEKKCEELAGCLFDYENLPESRAIKLEVIRSEFGSKSKQMDKNSFDELKKNSSNTKIENIDRKTLKQTGDQKKQDKLLYKPPGLSLKNIDAPPGLQLQPPPGIKTIKTECREEMEDFEKSDGSDSDYRPDENSQNLRAVSYQDIKVASKGLKLEITPGTLRINNSAMANSIAGVYLFNRFANPFPQCKPNVDLMCLVNYAIASNKPEVENAVTLIINQIFLKNYPILLVRRFIEPCIDNRRWSLSVIELIFELAHLFGYVCQFCPDDVTFMKNAWLIYFRSFKECRHEDFSEFRILPVEMDDIEHLVDYVDNYYCSRIEKKDNEIVENVRNRSNRRRHYSDRPDPPNYRYFHHYEYPELLHKRDDVYPVSPNCRNEIERYSNYSEFRCDFPPTFSHNESVHRTRYEKNDSKEFFLSSNGKYEKSDYQKNLDYEKEYDNRKRTDILLNRKDMENKNDIQPPISQVDQIWKKCEQIEPPNDFRELSEVPVLKDFHKPDVPYLRRIQEDGIYSSVEHYLDVQFRLLREDLVSPLRDGICLYRTNKSTQFNQLISSDNLNPDLKIINIEKIEGKQVSLREGLELRYGHLDRNSFSTVFSEEKQFKGGGLALLSSDNFNDDVHLVIASEVHYESWKIGLIIVEENIQSPLQTDKTYQLAIGSSYLPSYRYVLQNLKKINPFVPLPFERYLVHGKKTILRPSYQNQDLDDETKREFKKTEAYYENIRKLKQQEITKKYENVEKSEKEINDGSCENNYMSDADKQIMKQLKQPIFKPRVNNLTAEEADKIFIDNKWYSISTLLSDFHPTYFCESQRVAFCAAMSREMSIIQGPPGTGKTYIGVKIVETFLNNLNHWGIIEPILIVSYTNKALDHFLEKLLEMTKNIYLKSHGKKFPIVRFGMSSTSEVLTNARVLKNMISQDFKSVIPENISSLLNVAYKEKKKKAEEIALSACGMNSSKKNILSFELLSIVMHKDHKLEFRDWQILHTDSKGLPLNEDETLACWLLEKSFNKNQSIDILENSDIDTEIYEVLDDFNFNEENENELEDENALDELLETLNINCNDKNKLVELINSECENGFLSNNLWDIANDSKGTSAKIFNKIRKMHEKKYFLVDTELVSSLSEEEALILKTQPLKPEELEDIHKLFSLTRPKRWALYQYWCGILRTFLAEGLPKKIANYRESCEYLNHVLDKNDAELVKNALIIGATTSGCSKIRGILERVKPQIMIVEEGAEILEAHILSAMISSVQHVIMIGDHQQLRPRTAVHELGVNYGLNISMFERLVLRGLKHTQLTEQYRMNPNITKTIVRPSFYGNILDGKNVFEYPKVEGMKTNLFFWSHESVEEKENNSLKNMREVEMVYQLVKHLLKQKKYTPKDITVIATYSAQRNELIKKLEVNVDCNTCEPIVAVETVDSYQGCENKIVIVSIVRSFSENQESSGIGFIAIENRICVALTRAKHGMYVIGNGVYLKKHSKLWSNIVDNLHRFQLIDYLLPLKCTNHSNIVKVERPEDFQIVSPEGGCSQSCSFVKDCGHVCRRSCHPSFENQHSQFCDCECTKKCENEQYQHECSKKCGEECGKCQKYIEKKLECGHTITTICHNADNAKCDKKCSKLLDCGHECGNECVDDCMNSNECEMIVEKVLQCGHIRKLKCSDFKTLETIECIEKCRNELFGCEHICPEICGKPCAIECYQLVNVQLDCGHDYSVKCCDIGEVEIDEFNCEALVEKKLEPCGHYEMIKCSHEATSTLCGKECETMLTNCLHKCRNKCGDCFTSKEHKCQNPCLKSLDCGHRCTELCSDECPSCTSFCSTRCTHMQCGVGKNGFGRKCSDTCVLCTKKCSNRCVHRSCSKRCFEICDVKSCNKRCSEPLPCKHACLGLCGEICPKICGTCNRKSYTKCISIVSSKTPKFYSIIEVPSCGHTFPVEYLDKHVQELEKSKSFLRCPKEKCGKDLWGIHRYENYMKGMLLNNNMKKIENTLDFQKKEMEKQKSIVLKDFKTLEKRILLLIKFQKLQNLIALSKQMLNALSSIIIKMSMINVKLAKNFVKISFYSKLGQCFELMVKLLEQITRIRDKTLTKNCWPKKFGMMLVELFANCRLFDKQINDLEFLFKDVENVWQYEMTDALLPNFRNSIAKLAVNLELMHLLCFFITEKTDIQNDVAASLKKTCGVFLKMSITSNFVEVMNEVSKIIEQEYPEFVESGIYFKCASVTIPNF